MITFETDFLVIGSGIAGLSYAINVAEASPSARITVITKAKPEECNTRYAQGGIAAVMSLGDSFESHVRDTLIAGDGECDENIVRMVVREAPEHIRDLIYRGVDFDRSENGILDLAREGGHNCARVIHKSDHTGLEIETALLRRLSEHPNIQVYDHYFALDLITNLYEQLNCNRDACCTGAYLAVKQSEEIIMVHAKVTLLATGGIGQLFQQTTNPSVATGDGIAMASRAGARISDMEFLQYHPTALKTFPGESPFLISEAVRGAGAVLKNKDGLAFMSRYDDRKDLASRDIVSRAISTEMQEHGDDQVFLDCTSIPKKDFFEKFPVIFKTCICKGIDPSQHPIPVVPAMHYCCGGILTDEHGQSSIRNLYAAGECARTGLHGANRLASNSLLEAVVFAKRAALHAVKSIAEVPVRSIRRCMPHTFPDKETSRCLTTELRKAMSSLGVVVNSKSLQQAYSHLNTIRKQSAYRYTAQFSVEGAEFLNLLTVAEIVLWHSARRRKNKGTFFNIDLANNSIPEETLINSHFLRN